MCSEAEVEDLLIGTILTNASSRQLEKRHLIEKATAQNIKPAVPCLVEIQCHLRIYAHTEVVVNVDCAE